MELIYLAEKFNEDYTIVGTADRTLAEKANLRHLTTICVPFICDGGEDVKGKWIVHNRYYKQIAKGKECPPESYNLFGGHCTAENPENVIGLPVSEALLWDGIRRELSEELLLETSKEPSENAEVKSLEVWENDINTGIPQKTKNVKNALPYPLPLFSLIPIGFTEYSDKTNTEYSYIFALPVKFADYQQLVAADDYEKKGVKNNIYLPIEKFSANDLKKKWKAKNPQTEICDAITRLFSDENIEVFDKLRKTIEDYK